MPNAKRVAGGALMAIGIAVGLMTLRTVAGARAQAEAAVRAGAQAAAARADEARRAAETKARQAAKIPALRAALDAHVDTATLVDLFDNEDWWLPFRNEFALVRMIVGSDVLATRGKLPLGTRDAEVVAEARSHEVASAVVTVDDQQVQVTAARLPAGENPDEPGPLPVLVLANPISTGAPAAVPVPELGNHALYWTLAGGIGLAGFGLLLSGARPRRPTPVATQTVRLGTGDLDVEVIGGTLVEEVVHETTARMGSFGEPQPAPLLPPPAPPPPAGSNPTPAGYAAETVVAKFIDGHRDRKTTPRTAVGAMPVLPTTAIVPRALPFGRYQLRDRLSDGTMSEIFLADAAGPDGLKRTFVVKRLRPEMVREEALVAQFIDEARLQASLVHPNIVPVLDFGVVDGDYYMTQEYVPGRDLARLMGRYQGSGDTPLPTPFAYYIAYQALQALAFAHEMADRDGTPLGIVHRDIAVGNVMVSLQGEVKLIDFGIMTTGDRLGRTQVGLVKGNTNFMSPEQARGQVVDRRSDLFSLGLVLHYALTGQRLYSSGNDFGMIYQATNGPTPADYARIRALPEPAAWILEKALAFEPNERFQTAAEFADALAPHSTGGKTIAAKLMQRLFGEEIRREGGG